MARLREIVFDCRHPAALARFWAAALDGYAVRPYDAAEIARLAALGRTPETDACVIVDGPGAQLTFQEVAHDKALENRLHLDLASADRRAEVVRLCALGASVKSEHARHTVLRDPEGNEFCVADLR